MVTRAASGKPYRADPERLHPRVGEAPAEILPFPVQSERVGKPAAIRAREEGDVDNGSAACGQCAGLIHDVRPVAEVIASIVDEAEVILLRLGARA